LLKVKYRSTRGSGGAIGYADAILQGLAPDGGLYVPENYPQITREQLEQLRGKPYVEQFVAINSLFVDGDIDLPMQRELAAAAFSHEKFVDVVDANVVPVTQIAGRIYLQQLSLGPTAAFKDMALQPLGQHLNYVLEQRGQSLRMLGATSGDTGSSAEAAVKGLSRIQLTMLSPVTGMSDFQKAQMAQLSGGNIVNLSVDGRFDDCQDMVKALKKQPEFADLGAVNSINWGRVAAQVPYYVSGYLQAAEKVGDAVDFVVPSGNFGNVLAGYIARKIGVPIRKLIVASNENDVMHELIQTGVYRLRGAAKITSSPSMDITKASNCERVLPDIFSQASRVAQYMHEFETNGEVAFEEMGVAADSMRRLGFDSGVSTHSDRLASIAWAHEHGVAIDPHTADAVTVARSFMSMQSEDTTPMVCMGTALPVKFEETMKEALGAVPERPARFVGLEDSASVDEGFGDTLQPGDLESLARWVRDNKSSV
jgi:threonine synthase